MPGSNERALEKARTLPADAVILDLEDSVAPEGKPEAREKACGAIAEGGYGRREVVLRVNGLGAEWHEADIAAAARSGAEAVCVPKVQSENDLAAVRKGLVEAHAPGSLAIWAMIETPLGILNAERIAAAGPAEKNPVTVLIMGTNDLAKETRAVMTPGREAMLSWLSQCIVAARAFSLDILDGVYNDFRDEEGLRRECEHGRMLGMDGKTLIHPGQIVIANEVFSPPPDEVAQAHEIVAAFEKPENKGKGVINMNGKMVELLHRDAALRTIAIADAIVAD